jgi:hypothetical protein
MYRVLALGLTICLCGCGLSSSLIKSDAVSYDDVIEDTTNKLLLLNILRARDKAPLHFADIPLIHESIQATASLQAAVPFGVPRNSTLRDTATAAMGVQMAPSFDVVHLDSKDFVTGIASPIDPRFVKYWLDRGLDRRIVLLLFFSAAEIVETDPKTGQTTTIRIMNAPREAMDVIRQQTFPGSTGAREELRCDTQSDFQRYLKLINSLKAFFAHSYTQRQLLAEGLSLEPTSGIKDLQVIAALDPTKIQWTRKGRLYDLYAVSGEQKIALCNGVSLVDAGASGLGERKGCYQSVVDASGESNQTIPSELPMRYKKPLDPNELSDYCAQYNRFIDSGKMETPSGKPVAELRLQTRSVGEIIQFLGDLLEYQDELEKYFREHPQLALRLNNPVTFGYCPDERTAENPSPGCDDVFFNLRRDSCDARFTVTYRGRQYSVANYNSRADTEQQEMSCLPNEPSQSKQTASFKDHTLEVLSVVHQLVDLHKSASDIRATPYIQVLP